MEELHKVHDKFFRAVFTQEDNARDLLKNTLPEEIRGRLDLRLIKVEHNSVIDSRLSESQSDVLIRTRMRGSPALIYVLVEHKSYPDKWTMGAAPELLLLF